MIPLIKRIIKILFIVFAILLTFNYISIVHASGIDMDLPNDNTTYGNSNNAPTTTNATNNSSSAVVSNNSESALDSLTVSDMINIVLCAIGIILILLGIAIIIRQKSA